MRSHPSSSIRPLLLLACLLMACAERCTHTLAQINHADSSSGTMTDAVAAHPAAALSSAAADPPAAPDSAVIHLQRGPSDRNITTQHPPSRGRIGEKQGRSNLSSVSLSLVVLGCRFCCVCVGSIIVRERVAPEDAVTLITPAGGAVGLKQIRKERRQGSKSGAAAAEEAADDLEAGRQRQQQQQSVPTSASTRTVTDGHGKEQVALQRVQDMAARWWGAELTEQQKRMQRRPDDDQQPSATSTKSTPRNNQSGHEPHMRVSIVSEATSATAAAAASPPAQPDAEREMPKPAAASPTTEAPAPAPPAPAVTQPDIPYQPTIILHSTM